MEQRIEIDATVNTPHVILDMKEGLIDFRGKSIPEDAKAFYDPLVGEWFDKYKNAPAAKTTINIELEYFNTSSSLWIFTLLKKLMELQKTGADILVNWFFMDEDMLEIGEDYEKLVTLPFKKVEVPE